MKNAMDVARRMGQTTNISIGYDSGPVEGNQKAQGGSLGNRMHAAAQIAAVSPAAAIVHVEATMTPDREVATATAHLNSLPTPKNGPQG